MAVAPESSRKPQSLQIRRATAADAAACGKICFEAFSKVAAEHNFPPELPSPEMAIGVLSVMFAHPGFFCVVAEQDGKLIGSNCLDERTPIVGVGPITVDHAVQNRAAGRQLMQAVMSRAAERKFAGIRLVQAAYHNRSLSLYAKLGFVVREPLACMQGPAIQTTPAGYQVRSAQAADLAACNDLCLQVHGHDRGGNRGGGGIRRASAGLRHITRFLRPRGRRKQSGLASLDRQRERIQRPGNSGADSQRRTLSLVSRAWTPRRPAKHADDHRPLQRTGRRLPTLHSVLKRRANISKILATRTPRV